MKFLINKRVKAILICAVCLLIVISAAVADATDNSPLSNQKRSAAPDYSGYTAMLSIVSDSGKDYTRYGVPSYGHTYLVIENTSSSALDFCGRVIEPSENLTFGWWAISSHSGIWFGIESNFIEAYGRYPQRVALSREIDGDGIDRLCDYLLTHDIYTPLENCALRAVAAFNTAIPEARQLDCRVFVTPARVVNAITKLGGSSEIALSITYTKRQPSCGFGSGIEYFDLAFDEVE